MPPTTTTTTFSFAVMNDHWLSHWQLGSWCNIITVSPFRQNYQIISVLKRPGRLTGWLTKATQISKKRRTLKTPWILTDRQGLFFLLSWPWKGANYSQGISEKQRLSYFCKYRRNTSGVSMVVFPFYQAIHALIYPKSFDILSLTGESRGWANTSAIKTIPEDPRWTPKQHRECVLSDELTFTMWVLTVSSGADVDLSLCLAWTAVATMVELKRVNFSSGNKGFHSVWTWNTKHGKTRRGKRHTEPIWAGRWRWSTLCPAQGDRSLKPMGDEVRVLLPDDLHKCDFNISGFNGQWAIYGCSSNQTAVSTWFLLS